MHLQFIRAYLHYPFCMVSTLIWWELLQEKNLQKRSEIYHATVISMQIRRFSAAEQLSKHNNSWRHHHTGYEVLQIEEEHCKTCEHKGIHRCSIAQRRVSNCSGVLGKRPLNAAAVKAIYATCLEKFPLNWLESNVLAEKKCGRTETENILWTLILIAF